MRSSLRTKLIFVVVAGVMLAFTAIGAFRVHKERTQIYADLERSGQERVELIAQAVTHLVVGYDYSNMESLADRIARQSDVDGIVVRNASGKIMVARQGPQAAAEAGLSFLAPVVFSGTRVGSAELRISPARADAAARQSLFDVVVEQVFFACFVGAMMFLATSSTIVRPIVRISSHMREILANPDARHADDLDIDSKDEIGELARVFNSLNRRVREVQQRLREKIDLTGSELMVVNTTLQLRTGELERRTQDLEQALSLVEKLALTDSLTDLRNRRYFDDSLASAFARAQRFDEGLCLLLLDVDHFKQINDSHGHAAGDQVLQALAARFRERTRDTDIAARLGGDEFAFLLFRAERDDGLAFAESILSIVRATKLQFEGQEINLSVSIGMASVRDEVRSIESLYGAADDALYEAKRRGRGQVATCAFDKSVIRPDAAAQAKRESKEIS